MSTSNPFQNAIASSPQSKARVAGVFYLGTIIAGASALVFANGQMIANMVATICYVGVTLLFYHIFKPVNKNISLLAAFFSLAGCVSGALRPYAVLPSFIPNPLVFFGVYCLLIGYLIFRSTFLPKILGVLMAIGGLGWLTFLSPSLVDSLAPFNLAPGILGESALTLWLLAKGVNVQEWKKLALANA
ncbi:MAG: DUF4386 domain-containing protein [Chloroflexi bacterium]|nr:DUF4386 domain-containing protein [Chloroflexota bacterium]